MSTLAINEQVEALTRQAKEQARLAYLNLCCQIAKVPDGQNVPKELVEKAIAAFPAAGVPEAPGEVVALYRQCAAAAREEAAASGRLKELGGAEQIEVEQNAVAQLHREFEAQRVTMMAKVGEHGARIQHIVNARQASEAAKHALTSARARWDDVRYGFTGPAATIKRKGT